MKVKGILDDIKLKLIAHAGISEPTVADLLQYVIAVRDNKNHVTLRHLSIKKCSQFDGVGVTTGAALQEVLKERCGQSLKVLDERTERCRRKPMPL